MVYWWDAADRGHIICLHMVHGEGEPKENKSKWILKVHLLCWRAQQFVLVNPQDHFHWSIFHYRSHLHQGTKYHLKQQILPVHWAIYSGNEDRRMIWVYRCLLRTVISAWTKGWWVNIQTWKLTQPTGRYLWSSNMLRYSATSAAAWTRHMAASV